MTPMNADFFHEAAHIYRFVKSRGSDKIPMQPHTLNQRIYQHREINKPVCARAYVEVRSLHTAEQV